MRWGMYQYEEWNTTENLKRKNILTFLLAPKCYIEIILSFIHRFEEGAEQFRLDVAQNPNDTEESIWCFLCEAQLYGVDEARQRFLEVIHFKCHHENIIFEFSRVRK